MIADKRVTEWDSMQEILGADVLGTLVGVTPVSLARFRRAERDTPPEVAERLAFLSDVCLDLAGSYDAHGIRRWFERPRAQLQGSSPSQLLAGDWHPGDESASRVRRLAATLRS